MDQGDCIAALLSVSNYGALQKSIVVDSKGGSTPRGLIKPRGLTVEPTTEYIFVTDLKNGLIHIFSQIGYYINHLQDPYQIHLDNIYVTNTQQQVIFLLRLPDLKMIKMVGKIGSGREEFRYPTQLAVSPNQRLYVTDTYNDRLQILTTKLEFTDSLQHQTMHYPIDVKFSNNEIFVLSKTDWLCIHVFTLSGEMTRSIVTRGSGMQVRVQDSSVWTDTITF